jgi:hypothetical protein
LFDVRPPMARGPPKLNRDAVDRERVGPQVHRIATRTGNAECECPPPAQIPHS